MKFAEGTLRGNALFDIKANTKKPLELEFQGDNLKIQRILVDDPEKVSLEGSLLLDGHLEWNTTAKKENNGIYKTGAMEARLRDGTIHRFEILSKIFSLINSVHCERPTPRYCRPGTALQSPHLGHGSLRRQVESQES